MFGADGYRGWDSDSQNSKVLTRLHIQDEKEVLNSFIELFCKETLFRIALSQALNKKVDELIEFIQRKSNDYEKATALSSIRDLNKDTSRRRSIEEEEARRSSMGDKFERMKKLKGSIKHNLKRTVESMKEEFAELDSEIEHLEDELSRLNSEITKTGGELTCITMVNDDLSDELGRKTCMYVDMHQHVNIRSKGVLETQERVVHQKQVLEETIKEAEDANGLPKPRRVTMSAQRNPRLSEA